MVDSNSKKLNNLKEKEAIIIERQQKVTSLEKKVDKTANKLSEKL